MVRTFQLTKALAKLTVMENMRLGAVGQRGESVWRAMFPGFWRRQKQITIQAEDLLGRFKLDAKREDFAGSLVRRAAQAARDGPRAWSSPRW